MGSRAADRSDCIDEFRRSLEQDVLGKEVLRNLDSKGLSIMQSQILSVLAQACLSTDSICLDSSCIRTGAVAQRLAEQKLKDGPKED